MAVVANLIIASAAKKVIGANATLLNGAINNSVTTIVIDDNVFEDGDVIRIGQEQILVGTAGTTCTGCTRGYNSTDAAAHGDNQEVVLAAATSLLSYAFTTETLRGIRFNGNIDFSIGFFVDDVLKYVENYNFPVLGDLWPFPDTVPGSHTLKLGIWVRKDILDAASIDEAEFTAWFIGS